MMSFSHFCQTALKWIELLCRFPLATNGRNNRPLFLQLGKSLVYFLSVGTQCLRYVACGDGLSSLAHTLQYLFFHTDGFYMFNVLMHILYVQRITS